MRNFHPPGHVGTGSFKSLVNNDNIALGAAAGVSGLICAT